MQIIWTGIFEEFLLSIFVIRLRFLDVTIMFKAYVNFILGPNTLILYSLLISGLSYNMLWPTNSLNRSFRPWIILCIQHIRFVQREMSFTIQTVT